MDKHLIEVLYFMRSMDFHRAAALGEQPTRAGHDRMTIIHHADKQSRACSSSSRHVQERQPQNAQWKVCAKVLLDVQGLQKVPVQRVR